MSLSKYSSTPETTNTARLARLILGPCTDVLRDILKRKIPPSDLSKEVKLWIDDLKKNKKRNPLNPSQNDIIFPSPNNNYGGDYTDLDISILYIILRNVSKIQPHSKGWGESPDPADRCVAGNIERIRLLRNKYYGHSASLSLSDTEFNQELRNIWDIAVELDRHLGTLTFYQDSVNNIKTCSMDPECQQKLIKKLGAVEELSAVVSKNSETLNIMTRKLSMRADLKLEKEIETTAVMVRSHHEKMANILVKIRGYEKAKTLLETNRRVIIKGMPGAGKTTLAKCLLKFYMDQGKRPLKVLKMSKLYGQVSPIDNLAIFIDNAFGEFSVSINDFTAFVKMKDLIESLLKPNTSENGNLLILTIRTDIYRELVAKKKMDSLLNSSVIDLSMGEYALETKEMVMFLSSYNLPQNIQKEWILRQADLNLTLGFPQCCKLVHDNPDFGRDISSFLSSPSLFLKDYMENLIVEKSEKMAVLIYILLKGGKVKSPLLSYKEDQEMKIVALKMLDLDLRSFDLFQDCVNIFDGFLTIYDSINDSYTFSHSSVEEVLFHVLIAAFPEDTIKNCHHTVLQRLTSDHMVCIQTLYDKKLVYIVARRIISVLHSQLQNGYESISSLELWNNEEFYSLILSDRDCSNCIQNCMDLKGDTLMVHFAKSGHIRWIEHLLQNNAKEDQKYRSLNVACMENHENIVDLILSHGVESDLNTCFHAVQSGNLELLLKLCKSVDVDQIGLSVVSELANIRHSLIQEVCLSRQFHLVQPLNKHYPTLTHIKSQSGESVLHYATLCGDNDTCRYLVDNYPELLYLRNDDGLTALHTASLSGDRNLISFLIRKGMNEKALTNASKSILHIACLSANYEVCHFIVTNFPHLITIRDNNGYTVLHDACAGGDKKLISFLQNMNMDTYALSKDRKNVLHIACSNGKYDACKYLVTNYPQLIDVKDIDGYTVLHSACESGDRELISFLIEKGLDIEALTNDGKNVLHIACSKGKFDVCVFLINMYPQLKNVKNIDGFTALHYASKNEDKNIISFLIENGFDINSRSKSGVGVLHIACKNGTYDVCEYIVTNYPQLLEVKNNDGFTALHYASINKDRELIPFLIEKGLDVNALTNDGQSILHTACRFGEFNTCVYLVSNYSYLINIKDREGYTALHYASKSGNPNLIHFLIRKGMNEKALTSDGESVLHIACRNGMYDACEYIVKNYPRLTLISDKQHYTVLHEACVKGDERLISFLIEKGLDSEALTNEGGSILHIACRNGNYDACEYIIANFPHLINLEDKNGYTPLHYASISEDKNLISFLIRKGMDIKAMSKTGESVLHIACRNGNYDACEFYVTNYPQLMDIKEIHGYTALHSACASDNKKLIEFLRKKGFDINALTITGQNVLHIACINDRHDMCVYLGKNYPLLLHEKDKFGATVLHEAAWGGNLETFKYLVEEGLDVQCMTNDGRSVVDFMKEHNHDLNEYLRKNYPSLYRKKQKEDNCLIL